MDQVAETRADRFERRRAQEDGNLFGRLQAAATASRVQVQKYLKQGGGISIVEWRVLWDLAVAGPLSIQELASIQRADHSLISRAVPQMRKKGYVTLTRGAEDKRQTLVALTEEGRRVYDRAAPAMKERRDKLRAAFTEEELASFLSLIDRFEEYLKMTLDAPTEPLETT